MPANRIRAVKLDCLAAVKTTAPGARIESLGDARSRISVEGKTWVTSYPPALVREIFATKGAYACDEIMREEDPSYVEHALRHEVLGYVEPAEFAGKRVLDFGCGAGASTIVLSRLLPDCDLVGIELQERLLRLARLRARYFGRRNVRFLRSPAGDSLPGELGDFDYIVLSAVFEHLLPNERATLLPRLWRHLKAGGVLFLNQTPHRYSAIEFHTTGLPLINYLPDRVALRVARRFSRHVRRDMRWEEMLRAGIRGATVGEVLRILSRQGSPALLAPRASVGDRIDLWYGKLSPRRAWLKRTLWASLKACKLVTRLELTPQLALAIRKRA
jgi:SAM-dependent methyltransferase